MNKRILVVDDEKSIVDAIGYAFRREGYEVEVAYDGEEALQKVSTFNPQVLILDVMMPRMNGLEVCKKLEGRTNLGVILLTAKGDIVDKVLGLELGADDYLTKPFDVRELQARVNALVRRLEKVSPVPADFMEVGQLSLHLAQRKVLRAGQEIDLTPKEFDLLAQLLTHQERVYTRDELLDLVWGMDYFGGTRTVDIHIQRLRKKLGEPYQKLLQTVHGVGYKGLGEL